MVIGSEAGIFVLVLVLLAVFLFPFEIEDDDENDDETIAFAIKALPRAAENNETSFKTSGRTAKNL